MGEQFLSDGRRNSRAQNSYFTSMINLTMVNIRLFGLCFPHCLLVIMRNSGIHLGMKGLPAPSGFFGKPEVRTLVLETIS